MKEYKDCLYFSTSPCSRLDLSYEEVEENKNINSVRDKFEKLVPFEELSLTELQKCKYFWRKLKNQIEERIEYLQTMCSSRCFYGSEILNLKFTELTLERRLAELDRVLKTRPPIKTNRKKYMDYVWVTGDGRRLAIKDLEDSHLNNIVLYLRTRLKQIPDKGSYYHRRCEEILDFMEMEVEFRGLPNPVAPIKTLEWIRQQMEEKDGYKRNIVDCASG